MQLRDNVVRVAKNIFQSHAAFEGSEERLRLEISAMDSKALMRSRVREAVRNREKRIQSPLVRYNDLGQPVCNLCNITVKSESLWAAHIASRQHKASVEEYKAKAAGVRAPTPIEPPRAALDSAVPRTRLASDLPEDFFDARPGPSSSTPDSGRPSTKRVNTTSSPQPSTETSKHVPATAGTLPKGFFDDSNADSRARGIEPVKINIQDEYNQFRKSIKEDVKDVDERLEEEEFEAAEDREEREQMEQRVLLESIEAMRKRQQQKKAVAAVNLKLSQSDSSDDDDSSLESDDDKLFVDWRAKHM